MINVTNGVSIDIRINGEKLDEVTSRIWAQRSRHRSRLQAGILFRIAQTIAALARLRTICNEKHMSLNSKIKLMRSLVISALLYARETQ